MIDHERQRLIEAGSAARAEGMPLEANPAYAAQDESWLGGEFVVDWLERLLAWQFGWEMENTLRSDAAQDAFLSWFAGLFGPDRDEGPC